MIFVVGILTGISLCIAGIVLRRTNRNGDLGVLVYIGKNLFIYGGVIKFSNSNITFSKIN